MSIELDHLMVPCRNRVESAKLFAELFAVPWGQAFAGPFSAVYLNERLTLDFDETHEPFAIQHYCFRVDSSNFDAILSRLKVAGIPYRSTPHGPVDLLINTAFGGRMIYWNEPDGHIWEILTVSYARQSTG
jgi:catechol 2,3-dioxygenase-like lactoylglutathione lyase family enzyme